MRTLFGLVLAVAVLCSTSALPKDDYSFAETIPTADPPSNIAVSVVDVDCAALKSTVGVKLDTTNLPGKDPHWIVLGPGSPPYGGPSPYYTGWNGNWVQPYQSGTPDGNAPQGEYRYTIWFRLRCSRASYSGLSLSGWYLVDNEGAIYLNGTRLASCLSSTLCFAFKKTPFAATNFRPGLNALTVIVHNEPQSSPDHPNVPVGTLTGTAVNAALHGACGDVCLLYGGLKICKVAGPGVAVGSRATFQVGSTTIYVPAGPAPGGYCAMTPPIPLDSVVTVNEILPPGGHVTAIEAAPSDRLLSSSVPFATANVRIEGGVTDLTFTDRATTGFLEICKNGNVGGTFSFTVGPDNRGPFVVPAGACSAAIEVAAGTVIVREVARPGTKMIGCSAQPQDRQGPCVPSAGLSIVTVVPGGVETQTVAFITNQALPVDPPPHDGTSSSSSSGLKN